MGLKDIEESRMILKILTCTTGRQEMPFTEVKDTVGTASWGVGNQDYSMLALNANLILNRSVKQPVEQKREKTTLDFMKHIQIEMSVWKLTEYRGS